MAQKKLLRVLYTVNGSPQYILARSYSQVQVTLIPTNHHEAGSSNGVQELQCIYASVSLKTCLDTICRSSPELTHDTSRDFSLYVLDPLESNSAPAPVQINNSNKEKTASKNAAASAEPRGVAVGLGLMSWALATDDSDAAQVVGTLVKQPNGQDALEVIFALRETTAMKRPAWSLPPASSHPSSSQASTSGRVPEPPSSSQPESKPVLSEQLLSERSDQITRETLASIQQRNKPKTKPPPKPVKPSTVPATESDKLLNAQVNIGPTRKKGRRPKAATPVLNSGPNISNGSLTASGSWAQDAIVIDGSDSDSVQPSSTANISQRTRQSSNGVRDLTKSKGNAAAQKASSNAPALAPPPESAPISAPHVKTEPQDYSLLDILAYLSAATTTEPNAQNAAILAALGTIDAKAPEPSTPQTPAPQEAPPNPALISALKQLLSVCLQQPSSTSAISQTPQVNTGRLMQPPSSHSKADSANTHANSDVTPNDKENVNPKPKRPTEKDGKSIKAPQSSPPVASSSANYATNRRSSHSERPLQSVTFGARTNEGSSSKVLQTTAASSVNNSENLTRKRTLSDFMDEKEHQKSKAKGKGKERERERPERREKNSSSRKVNPVDSMRHYPMILASAQPRSEQPSNYYRTALECMTSPGRPRPELDLVGQSSTFSIPLSSSSSFRSQFHDRLLSPSRRISASSPARKEMRRKYVVPDWARTNTSTQPRLSEEALRAQEDADKAKKQERIAARKRLPSHLNRGKNKSAPPSRSQTNSGDDEAELPPVASSSTLGPISASRGPIVSSDRPLFAAADVSFPFLTTRSSSPPPRPTTIPQTPKTPVRSRTGATPGGEEDSLFTPIGRSGSLFGSARSYSLRTPLQSILTSPLGNRKKAKISPATSLLTGLSFPSSSSWSKTSSSVHSSEDTRTVRGSEGRKSLERQLDAALDDLDAPPSSLPIASSDIDIDERYAEVGTNDNDQDVNINDDDEIIPVKQHWQGLPPSSPPAPSSPMLLPETPDDDEDMEEIPIATSDSETDAEMTPIDSPAEYFDEELAESMSAADLAAFFPDILTQHQSADGGMDDIFQQFTHLSSDASGSMDGGGESGSQASDQTQIDQQGFDALFQDGLEGIDFTEFWETFKPLIDGSTQFASTDPAGGENDTSSPGHEAESVGGVDHAKLADDVQALLSGCLM